MPTKYTGQVNKHRVGQIVILSNGSHAKVVKTASGAKTLRFVKKQKGSGPLSFASSRKVINQYGKSDDDFPRANVKNMYYDRKDNKLYEYVDDETEPIAYYNAKHIARGTFGSVDLYKSEDQERAIALKSFTRTKDAQDESDIVNILNSKAAVCDYVPAKVLYNPTYDIVIAMNFRANLGDIVKLFFARKFKPEDMSIIAEEIFRELLKMCQCLYRTGFNYTDLKPDNVLIYVRNGRVFLQFGDLGSIIQPEKAVIDNSYIASFTPFEHALIFYGSNPFKDFVVEYDEKVMTFGCACTVLSLLTPLSRLLAWDKITKYNLKELKEKINKSLSGTITPELKLALLNCIQEKYEDTPTLAQALKMLPAPAPVSNKPIRPMRKKTASKIDRVDSAKSMKASSEKKSSILETLGKYLDLSSYKLF